MKNKSKPIKILFYLGFLFSFILIHNGCDSSTNNINQKAPSIHGYWNEVKSVYFKELIDTGLSDIMSDSLNIDTGSILHSWEINTRINILKRHSRNWWKDIIDTAAQETDYAIFEMNDSSLNVETLLKTNVSDSAITIYQYHFLSDTLVLESKSENYFHLETITRYLVPANVPYPSEWSYDTSFISTNTNKTMMGCWWGIKIDVEEMGKISLFNDTGIINCSDSIPTVWNFLETYNILEMYNYKDDVKTLSINQSYYSITDTSILLTSTFKSDKGFIRDSYLYYRNYCIYDFIGDTLVLQYKGNILDDTYSIYMVRQNKLIPDHWLD